MYLDILGGIKYKEKTEIYNITFYFPFWWISTFLTTMFEGPICKWSFNGII